MSSTCNEFNELLLDLAYDELDASTSGRLLQHKDQCASCQKAFDELMGVRNMARQFDPPPVPGHFDSDILALARQTAASFKAAKTADSQTPSSVPTPIFKSPSLLEKIQAFILRPAIIGTGLAAAAVLVAVTSIKNDAHNTMMEPVDGAPFVGGKPVVEQEELPSSEESAAKADMKAPAKEALATMADDAVPPAPQRIQKAGPDYEPLYRQQADETEKQARRGEVKDTPLAADNLVDEKKSATPRINKNPADLLQQKSSKGIVSTGTARGSAAHKKKTSIYNANQDALSAMQAPAHTQMESAADAEVGSDRAAAYDDGAEEVTRSTFESGLAAYNQGDCKTAIALFTAYVDSPEGPAGRIPMATHYIARCEKRTGRCGKALIHYERLLSQYSTYGNRADALYEAAQCHQKLGHADRAQTLLEELSLDPDWRAKAQKMMAHP